MQDIPFDFDNPEETGKYSAFSRFITQYDPNSPKDIPIFVYGTLREGFGLNSTLKEYKSEFVGLFKTEQRYVMFDTGSFPAIIPYKNGVNVTGEKYLVSKECLQILDFIEGHPDMYIRTLIDVYNEEDGSIETAFVYVWNDTIKATMRPIENGDWTDYKTSPSSSKKDPYLELARKHLVVDDFQDYFGSKNHEQSQQGAVFEYDYYDEEVELYDLDDYEGKNERF
jgi:gamma-glutamylcyclotransferase (GGCT)/AIG2-like uncharacterized protein YtfP